MAYNADDLARYLGEIIKDNKQMKQDLNKNYIQSGVVRSQTSVEIAGVIYPAIFAIDDIFNTGDGVKCMFFKGNSKVMVVGR